MEMSLKKTLARVLNTILIVETGKDDGWTYLKLSNGNYIAWKFYQASGLNLTTASANTYYGTTKNVNLPSFSTGCLFVSATEESSLSSGVYVYRVERASASIMIDYRAHVSVSGAVCGTNIFVIGTY